MFRTALAFALGAISTYAISIEAQTNTEHVPASDCNLVDYCAFTPPENAVCFRGDVMDAGEN